MLSVECSTKDRWLYSKSWPCGRGGNAVPEFVALTGPFADKRKYYIRCESEAGKPRISIAASPEGSAYWI